MSQPLSECFSYYRLALRVKSVSSYLRFLFFACFRSTVTRTCTIKQLPMKIIFMICSDISMKLQMIIEKKETSRKRIEQKQTLRTL